MGRKQENSRVDQPGMKKNVVTTRREKDEGCRRAAKKPPPHLTRSEKGKSLQCVGKKKKRTGRKTTPKKREGLRHSILRS